MKKIVAFLSLALIGGLCAAAPTYLDPFRPRNPTQPWYNASIVNSQGWQYGRANCGRLATPPITTLAGCVACCNLAVIPTGPLNPGQVNNCVSYCASIFPNIPTNGWWDYFI